MLSKDVKISSLRNWGRPKKKVKHPLFLLTQKEREEFLYSKIHVRGRPKRITIKKESK